MSSADQDEIARLRAELDAAKKKNTKPFALKVSEKGALSVYGLGRFPVTLYKGQWERLLAEVPKIQQFLHDNAGMLKSKDE